MLDAVTRRRIDTARDILVGKVPDPKSQVEQITIALIYKFMDDIDAQSEELGGQRKFFADDFARYGWAKLMRSGLGGYEMLNLYADAITRMPENPGIPPLFRDIFNNAYLPYRDPETLRMFLKVIDEFSYDHSERLGDAFEYLLSVLGSQGDAGQFRTPRHIIDFIVEIIDPKKDESVLDPACGTAGFLISSYKHIMDANTDESGQITLTPDERTRLANNFNGYDISPDMVRLSLVNMYLHGFPQPNIYEYDTLTSDERWNEFADVILANPPFMNPKGGIRPHNMFSIKARRSEVLFVDYIAEHLTSAGRAGVIVPEGIIFQSQNAHKQLRKMLVDDYLVAVISLPAGVFKPYSGVKTSILIMDKSLAKKSDSIAFFKVENDGYDLGDQRRPIADNDLPQAENEIAEYLCRLRTDEPLDDLESTIGLIVLRDKIAVNEEYSLSGERYRESVRRLSHFPIVPLGEVAEVIAGQSPPGSSYNDTGVGTPFYQGKTEFSETFIGVPKKWTTDPRRFAEDGDILMSVRAPVGPVNFATQQICIGRGLAAIRPMSGRILSAYAFYILHSLESEITGDAGAAFASINKGSIEKISIPLPPVEVQRDIISEIAGYQKVIDGARAVIENYRPHIAIDPEWPMVELGELSEVIAGQSPPGKSYNDLGTGTPFYQGRIEFGELFMGKPKKWTTDPRKFAEDGDILMSVRAPVGPVNFATQQICIGRGLAAIRTTAYDRLLHTYVFYVLRDLESEITGSTGAMFASINKGEIEKIGIPLPSLDVQKEIVVEIEAEQSLVNANRELVTRMEGKIAAAIGRVWESSK